MDAIEVIRAKRDGGELTGEQIRWVVDAYTGGRVAEEQMSALAMAVYLRGMSRREVAEWTEAMIASGERMSFADLPRPTADKHSTGGVGDKITLPLSPAVAACGAIVPQLSGRGLGHTGGTLDKLESVPGWRASLSPDEMRAQLSDVGAVVCAAGAGLAPADRKLYALRDVTGTVESIPLIASSIMSKKIAEGSASLVLDVKVGTGAFMKSVDDARTLAETMVGLGTAHGVRTVALLTDMSTPLGRTAGNALEVAESVEVLTACFCEMSDRMSFTEVTSEFAAAVSPLSSRATVSETGVVDAAVTVTETPGSTSENVLVELVTVWAAPLPAHSVSWASCAARTCAAPGSESRFVAVPAATSAGVPRYAVNAPAAPVFVELSCNRYRG